jgi:hypothetical protein
MPRPVHAAFFLFFFGTIVPIQSQSEFPHELHPTPARRRLSPGPHRRFAAGQAAGPGAGRLHHHHDRDRARRPAAADRPGPGRVRGAGRATGHPVRGRLGAGGDSNHRRHPRMESSSPAAAGHRRPVPVQRDHRAVHRLCADAGGALWGRHGGRPAVGPAGRLRAPHGGDAPTGPGPGGGGRGPAAGAVPGRAGRRAQARW